MSGYAELHCLTNFTFLRGASHAEELVARAAELGYAALAVTDECSLAGVVRAHRAAKEHGLHLIIGSEIRLDDGIKLVLLAADREGYGNLSELITRGRRRSEKGAYRLDREDLADGLPGCLAIWLPPGTDTRDEGRGARENETSESVAAEGNQDFRGFRRSYGGGEANAAEWVAGTFPGRAWIAAELHCEADDAGKLSRLRALGESAGLPLVATGDVHMHRRGRRALQDLFTAIRLGTTVAEAGTALYPNGERHLRPKVHLAEIYPPEWLAESVAIAAHCRFSLEELKYNYPDETTPAGETPGGYLRRLTEAGLRQFWPEGEPEKVRRLVEHELTIIGELGYEPYFLTVYDLVRFARERGILCQGRGSAANSAVCYCLGITAVDPSRSEMLFERFISKERDEPPDIDVDFEHTRREEVLQYLYERYGRERSAIAATVITYRTRSALRDTGKALGLSVNEVDRLAGAFTRWERRAALAPQISHQRVAGRSDARRAPAGMAVALSRGRNAADGRPAARPEAERLREAGFDPESPVIRRLLVLVWEMLDFPRHLSQHVGGMVITRDPLPRLVPIENAAMEGRTVIQWDKDDLDALGLLKIDCLALGMLSAIHKAFDLVERHRGRRLTLATVPAEDPAVYAMLCRADTVGVFQIESRAQMAMLPRLRPRTFYDLVIEVAIIRPGPIQGNMVHPYLKRRQGLEPITYPGPEAEAVLARTLGVPIFQEQVIKLAMVAAGFTAGEADRLRRAIAAWKKGRGLAAFEEKLRSGMAERGYPAEFADQVIEQIKGFGEYGFPESHAASFALLAYVSSWLKRHEPAAFTCALLNSQPMGFYAPAQLVRDAREHGVEVLPLDVAASNWDCTLEVASGEWRVARNTVASGESRVARQGQSCASPKRGSKVRGHRLPATGDLSSSPLATRNSPLALRLGLRMVKGLKKAAAERLVAARAEGAFRSVADLARRAGLSKADLERLAAAGALAGLAGDRHQARWEVLGTETTLPLFNDPSFNEEMPALPHPSEGEDLVADYAHVGLSLGRHPLALLRERLARLRCVPISEATARPDRAFVRIAGLVITRQRPGDGRTTFLTIEDESGIANIIVWEALGERYRKIIAGGRLIGVTGTLQSESGVIHVVAGRLEDYSGLLGNLTTRSRDFC